MEPPFSPVPDSPPDLPASCRLIEEGGRRFVLLGTAHVSAESTREVEFVIAALRPDTVAVELCRSRYEALTGGNALEARAAGTKETRAGRGGPRLARYLLSSFQRRAARALDVRPGAEMLRAVELARERGSHLILADRDVAVTIQRAWARLSFWARLKLGSGMLAGLFSASALKTPEIERLKNQEVMADLMSELARGYPALADTLIRERDLYLMDSIRGAPGATVLAVVGAGHLQGIAENWGRPVDRRELETVPK